jgi:hypothetical protein
MPATAPIHAEGFTRPASGDGDGWVMFAGAMLGLLATLNVIYGIAAISNSKVFVRDAEYVFANLETWGWLYLIVGIVQGAAALSIWARTAWGRWVGIVSAAVNALIQMLAIPAHPFLAVTLFSVDILVIWALLNYGGRVAEA